MGQKVHPIGLRLIKQLKWDNECHASKSLMSRLPSRGSVFRLRFRAIKPSDRKPVANHEECHNDHTFEYRHSMELLAIVGDYPEFIVLLERKYELPFPFDQVDDMSAVFWDICIQRETSRKNRKTDCRCHAEHNPPEYAAETILIGGEGGRVSSKQAQDD